MLILVIISIEISTEIAAAIPESDSTIKRYAMIFLADLFSYVPKPFLLPRWRQISCHFDALMKTLN